MDTNKKPAYWKDGHLNSTPYSTSLSLLNQDHREDFRQEMARNGIIFYGNIIADAQIHRFAHEGCGDLDCWYVFYEFAGAYGDWSRGIKEKWSIKSDHLNDEYRHICDHQIQAAQTALKEETQYGHEDTTHKAQVLWDKALETGCTPYLERKQVDTIGIRFEDDQLIIPMRDTDGNLWSIQRIYPDGKKRFLKGGRKKGCFHVLGDLNDKTENVFVVEGYATGASVHMATQVPTIVAFDAGNLEHVIAALKNKYPNTSITIAADDDQWKEGNIGRETALKLQEQYGYAVVFPHFQDHQTQPTDFNDLHVLEGLVVVAKQLKNVNALSWPDPQEINSSLLPVSPLPADLIPETLRDYCVDIHERMQCPLDFPAAGIIVMLGSLIGTACAIRPKQFDPWKVVPNLWGGIVGQPGALKTPALNEALSSLEKLERQARTLYEEERRDYEQTQQALKIHRDATESRIKRDSKHQSQSIEQIKQTLSEIKPMDMPKERRYRTTDPTVEKLAELLKDNPRGLLLWRDELMALFRTWEKDGHQGDRSFYLESWNAQGTHITDRIGRGTIHTRNPCISILGCIQPQILRRILNGAIYDYNDGLFQRFQMLVYPDPCPWQHVDRPANEVAKKRVIKVSELIASMDFYQHGAQKQDEEGIPYFHFDVRAQEFFNNWMVDHKRKVINEDEPPIIREHLDKYTKLLPSLALIFHILDIAEERAAGSISLECVERAAAWCDYLETHMRRIYGLILNGSDYYGGVLAQKIKQGKLKDLFTVRDVYRKSWTDLTDHKIVMDACEYLVDAGWLQAVVTPPKFGQREKTEYQINPKVLKK